MNTYIDLFNDANGVRFGNWTQEFLAPALFPDLRLRDHGTEFDLLSAIGARVEAKAIRAVCAPGVFSERASICFNNGTIGLTSRALYSVEGEGMKGLNSQDALCRLCNPNFQQTHPKDFDYLLGFVVFLDKVRVYLVPSRVINTQSGRNCDEGGIPLNIQHRHNRDEGSVNISHCLNYLSYTFTAPFGRVGKLLDEEILSEKVYFSDLAKKLH